MTDDIEDAVNALYVHVNLRALLDNTTSLRVLKLPFLPRPPLHTSSEDMEIHDFHLRSASLQELWLFRARPSDTFYLRHPSDFPSLRELRITNQLVLLPSSSSLVLGLTRRLVEFPLRIGDAGFFQLTGGKGVEGNEGGGTTLEILEALRPLRDRDATQDVSQLDVISFRDIVADSMRLIVEMFPRVHELRTVYWNEEDDEDYLMAGERATRYFDRERGLLDALQRAEDLNYISLFVDTFPIPYDIFAVFAYAGQQRRSLFIELSFSNLVSEENLFFFRRMWEVYCAVGLPHDKYYVLDLTQL